ncbi:hypothetical protein [Desulfopila inferna]|uniref:hypothetical protein n=1 Tax=Desulfopila inferna TaxID=468528 RepID=UPI001964CCE1|nr:hypothetical protein [Desulfopila inferna]MBM9604117.1 hypothetical protein [Desulfopila inferna]
MSSKIRLNQKLKRVELKSFEIENQIVFEFFNKLQVDQRDDQLLKALYIGVLALIEDRLSAFLAKTSNELGTELESLKMIFDMKQELFYKTAIKGVLGEEECAEYLTNLVEEKKLNDTITLTGNLAGVLPKNKTGDIVCQLNNDPGVSIVVECKFDKSLKLGDISQKDVFTKKIDTAWSQMLESQVNRGSKASIIVFDVSLVDNSIINRFGGVGYIEEIGFVSIIDSQKGDYRNLSIAYLLARDLVLNSKAIEYNPQLLRILINRILKDIKDSFLIRSLVERNISTNKEILKQLEKSFLSMEFNYKYLTKFLSDGILTNEDLLDFYMSEDIKEKYKILEKEIIDL